MKKTLIIPFLLACFVAAAFAQEPGSAAPDFTGFTPEKTPLTLADYRGKVVLLDFWASWCGPCRKEMPFLVELHKTYRDKDFVILAVNVDTDRKKMLGFLKKLGIEIPFGIIFDNEQRIPPLYKLETMPTTFLIDKQGLVRYRHAGFEESEKDVYRKEIQELLAENTSRDQQ